MLFIMLIPSTVWGWEDAQVIGFILTHNPVLQAYRQTATADRLLNRLPVLQARLDERYQAAAALDATEENTARVRQAADDRKAVAQAHRTAAITAPEQAAALKALNQVKRQSHRRDGSSRSGAGASPDCGQLRTLRFQAPHGAH